MTEKKDEENETKTKDISEKVHDPEVGQPRNALPRGQSRAYKGMRLLLRGAEKLNLCEY